MFAIATPQTVELFAVDPNDPKASPESHGTATFSHPTDDVSECQLTIASRDKVWTFRFNTQGTVISTDYADDATRKAEDAAAKKAVEKNLADAAKTSADVSVDHHLLTELAPERTQAISDKLARERGVDLVGNVNTTQTLQEPWTVTTRDPV